MAQAVSTTNIGSTNVKCFSFQNPSSINGPSGSFQLWINGSEVLGRMTIQTLFGMGSTTLLNLAGTSSDTGSVVCTLQGKGISTQGLDSYANSTYAEIGMTLTFSSDWTQGSLVFSADLPEVSGGLPVTPVTCPSPSGNGS